MKLRGEVGLLRRQFATQQDKTNNVASAPQRRSSLKGHIPGAYIAKGQLQFAGYDTPEAAMESMNWAMLTGTFEQANEGLHPDLLDQEATSQKEKEGFESRQKMLAPLFKGMQVVARKDLADGKVELKVKLDTDPIPGQQGKMPEYMIQPMSSVNGQWRISGSTRGYEDQWGKDGQIQTYTQ